MKITKITKISALISMLFIIAGLYSCNISTIIEETSTESKTTEIIENIGEVKNSETTTEAVKIIEPTTVAKESELNAQNIINITGENADVSEDFLESLKNFSLDSAAKIFTENKNENLCYSPLSLYIALSLAARGAESQTQTEMFDALALNGKDINYISEQTGKLIRKTYFDNEYGSIKIANSIWLREDAELKKDYTDNAEKNFYSSVFSVDFGNTETPDSMKKWVEENTNKLISPKFEIDPTIFMYIINTLYFKDAWIEFFLENANTNEIFSGLNNQSIACEFMNKKIHGSPYFKGDGFTASSLSFANGGKMTFILPDESVDIYDLAASPEKLDYALNANNADRMDVTYKVPKFKSTANFDLIGILKNMGINQVFESTADFSGMTDTWVYISEVRQATYIKVDETGVEAAAMTAIAMPESGPMPQEEADFFLDRPFIYFITDRNGVILFKGIIVNPNE